MLMLIMFMLITLLHHALSQCTSNAIRDIYSSSNFQIMNITDSDYYYIYQNYSNKVTNFNPVSSTSSSNYCTNSTKIMGSVSSFCCTDADTMIIADQFFAKYVYGLYIQMAQKYILTAASYAAKYRAQCPLKAGTDTIEISTKLAKDANRSINGFYYAVGKIAEAAQPWAQTETCLICADDTTINNYYVNGTLMANQKSWKSMTQNLGKAAYQGLNALHSFVLDINSAYKGYVDSKAKSSNCDSFAKYVPDNLYWCTSNDDCTTYMTSFWQNTALEYQTFVSFLNGQNPLPNRLLSEEETSSRLLSSRLLMTAGNSSGAGFSTSTYFTSQIKVQNMDMQTLYEVHGWMLMGMTTVLFSMLI